MSRIALGVVILLILAASLFFGLRHLENRRVATELAAADKEMAGDHLYAARSRLKRLLERHPTRGDVLLRLARCSQVMGNLDDAAEFWSRVPADSPQALEATASRAEVLINRGRYAPAESSLVEVLEKNPPSRESYNAYRALVRVYRFEGRVDDVRTILQSIWAFAPRPAEVLKELWALDNSPSPVEAMERAIRASTDPNDDRVLLARANVAILAGRPLEALPLLDTCLKARPDDPAVWRSRLRLGLAADRPDLVIDAAKHLSVSEVTAVERQEIQAWLAARGIGKETEKHALHAVLKVDPGNASALDRLSAIEQQEGHAKQAEELRASKATIDRAKDAYRKDLLGATDLNSQAPTLAKLSESLHRSFDADAWNAIASGKLPRVSKVPKKTPTTESLLASLGNPALPESYSGGKEPRATALFVDKAESAGLSFTFENGETPLRQLPETMSGGLALLDSNGDGLLDVYVVQGGPCRMSEPDETRPPDRLFQGKADGTFADVTKEAGIDALPRSYGLAVTVADYDNDGDPDIFTSRLRSYMLLRNRGDGTFEDATADAGLAGDRDNPTSAAFADLDCDGDLDLYVCHYMIWDPSAPTLCKNDKGEYFYCDPSKVQAAADHLFRNDKGRFVDVTEAAGIVDTEGRGLGVVATDLDDDGMVDLYVANDGTANFLFLNKGGFHFEENGHGAGVAANADGGYQAGMGVACGDLNGDGKPDLLVTNFYGEGTTFYQNLGGGTFFDRSADSGISAVTRHRLGFGIGTLDVNNDGALDILEVNGHVNDNRPFFPYQMPATLLAGDGTGHFTDLSNSAGDLFLVARVGRGLALGDINRDGRVDAIILSQNEPLVYAQNETDGGHSLTLRLQGTKSNRDAIGSKIKIQTGGRTLWRYVVGGSSYQSANDLAVIVGIGEQKQADVEVIWPNGEHAQFDGLAADSAYRIVEGEAKPAILEGYGPKDR